MRTIHNQKIIILVFVTASIFLFLICNKSSDNTTLDEVRLKDNEVSKKQFAVYIRDSKDAEYQEYTNDNNLIPEGYKLDSEQSGCVDGNGEKVTTDGIITQTADNKITLKSNKTVYCYLYFEKNSFSGTGSDLAKSKSKGLIATTGKGDLAYRYVGTKDDVENYICFGATNKDDCTSEDSNYLYRIIGVDTNDRLKLIKDTAISTQWHSNYTENAVWDTGSSKIPAKLYTDLNSSSFLDSTTYVPNGWQEKIDKTTWNIGDVNSDSYAQSGGDAIYNQEQTTSVTTPSEIGLMYLSDYYYSLDGEGTKNCRDNSSDYAQCKTSWLHLSNNSTSQSSVEWTMTRYGYRSSNGFYYAWVVASNGESGWYDLDDTLAVRPVFYLTTDSVIKDGSGTSDDPYLLESPEETGNRIATEKFGEVPAHFNTTPTGDMYRFVGKQEESESINNYVCFGPDNCNKEATNAHLYRIIGITSDGKMKIQKNSSITPAQWYTSKESDISWSQSTMYTNTLKNTFYDDETYLSQGMKDKIDTKYKWNTGDVNGTSASQIGTGDTVYNLEKLTQTHTGEIGLAYLSDYYFAYDEQGTQNCYNNSPFCKSWMVPSEYQTLWSNQSWEWTMTRYGLSDSDYRAWRVYSNGTVAWLNLNVSTAVRPVFYLNSDVTLTTKGNSNSPKGSLENPWVIS